MRQKSHADAVKGMSDKDAISYLVDMLDRDMAALNARRCHVLGHLNNPQIRRGPLSVLLCLWDKRGKPVTYDQISASVEFEADAGKQYDYISPTALAAHVQRLRRAITKHNWPIKIHTIYGIGQRLELLDPEWSIEPKDDGTALAEQRSNP